MLGSGWSVTGATGPPPHCPRWIGHARHYSGQVQIVCKMAHARAASPEPDMGALINAPQSSAGGRAVVDYVVLGQWTAHSAETLGYSRSHHARQPRRSPARPSVSPPAARAVLLVVRRKQRQRTGKHSWPAGAALVYAGLAEATRVRAGRRAPRCSSPRGCGGQPAGNR
jgi:hypothetical protein